MAAPALNFPRFPQLPAELRDQIWEYCLPHRFHELDYSQGECVFDKMDNNGRPPCELSHTTGMNWDPPLISRVCRESRYVAFKDGGSVVDAPESRHGEALWRAWTLPFCYVPWRDKVRDVTHLNWTPSHEAGGYYEGHPLGFLAREASRMSGCGSLMIELLDDMYATPRYWKASRQILRKSDPLPPLPADQLKDLEALKQVSKWLVVMRVVVVHADIKDVSGTGLFGLLGDSPVQIVELSEEERIGALMSLAETSECNKPVTVRQDFDRKHIDSMRSRLRTVVWEQYGSVELLATMRPAIMFRLCTQMCNHVTDGRSLSSRVK